MFVSCSFTATAYSSSVYCRESGLGKRRDAGKERGIPGVCSVEGRHFILIGPEHTGLVFVYFAKKKKKKKICHQFPETNAPGELQICQFLSRLTKLQRCRYPASEQDKFLSGVKSERFVNLHAMI